MVGSALDAARDADAVLILTDWAQFKDAPLQTVAQLMRGRLLLDGRNMLDPAAVVAAGLTYVGMGRRIRVPDRQLVEQR
jgi:UDPglucose 6-dehydrogenase